MPYELPLPKKLRAEGWKVKIREKERVEPPHVTVMHKAEEWRLGLRGQAAARAAWRPDQGYRRRSDARHRCALGEPERSLGREVSG